jgi:hypothetical protein
MKKHLDFYKACMRAGCLPESGLCSCADDDDSGYISSKLLDLFYPTPDDMLRLVNDGMPSMYWACGVQLDKIDNNFDRIFTPLRQNIVLFMAAINNEL